MLLDPHDNLLLYGLTHSGKTTQIAEIIKVMAAESGKPALVYVTDWGSCQPLYALRDAGMVELEEHQYGTDPFVWIDSAVQGLRLVNEHWAKTDLTRYCLSAMESLTGLGELVLHALGHQVGAGMGSDAMKAPRLTIQAQGYQVTIAANSPTHYNMTQKYLLEKVWQSQGLPFPVIWTAHEDVAVPEKRDDQGNIRAEVAVAPGVRGMIGPLVAGHALTMHLGKYFVLTLRLKQEVSAHGVKHVLHTTRHKDGFYEGLAANRAPLGTKITVPSIFEPANVVQFLQVLQAARAEERQRFKL